MSAPAPQLNPDASYFIWTIGCQMNEADSRHLASQLETLGYAPATEIDAADLIILNTCVVRQQAEDKIYGRLGSLQAVKKKRPDVVVGVMGCLVGVKDNPKLKKRFPYVDVFMPPSNTEPLIDFLENRGRIDPGIAADASARGLRDRVQDAEFRLPVNEQGTSVTAFIPVVLGCSHACTFCIIPSRRGGERSRPPAEILSEVTALAEQGIKEVMLLGQIVDRYGHDLEDGIDLPGLLRDVHEVDGVERIRFLTSHPNYMTDDLLDTVAELPKLCPHLEVPIQAGNDAVLKRMRRGYTSGDFRELVTRIRQRIPDASINTDVIVGFCGETEDQFMDTFRAMEDLRFDKVHIARYSTRPGTPASRRLEDDVSDVEKERRRLMLDELQKSILEEKNAALVGRTVEVLIEARQKGRWRGRTPHNRLVFFEDDRELAGQIMPVKIDIASAYSLIGAVADHVNAETG